MVRRGGRFMRFVATTNAQVEKEMELEASHPFYGESVEYAQMRQERERQRAALDQRRHRENTKPISILVQILTGRKIYLTVDPKHCTLLDVKKKIQAKEGIHPDQQILLWNGERLKDGGLKELRIHEGATFFLTLRNRGG